MEAHDVQLRDVTKRYVVAVGRSSWMWAAWTSCPEPQRRALRILPQAMTTDDS